MNLDIKKRIDEIANPEAIKLFFSLVKNLIIENNISADDERFVLNVRNDDRKRFSVSINSRLVLYIKAGEEFGFMVNQEDWHLLDKILFLKKESYGKYEPASFLVTFSLDTFLNHQELITNNWLKSCRSYLPKQEKSQYKRHHLEELYSISTNTNLLENYLKDLPINYSKFQEIISDFKDYIKSEDSVLKNFSIQSIQNSYVWISDNHGIIGEDGFCHYEFIVRNRKYPRKIWVELHFEKQWRKKAKTLFTEELPQGFFWNDDHGGTENSIAVETSFDFQDPDLFNKLEIALHQLDETFGNIVRGLQALNVKDDFIKWFVEKDGSSHNYYSQQFGSNLDRFRSEIDKYEELYKNDFGNDLFVIDIRNIKEKTEEISKNIYSNSPSFSEYSQNNNNGRPKAILGKKNYIAFLNEYFTIQKDEKDSSNKYLKNKMQVNQILYGPPGTGKTYNTINKALSILEAKTQKEIDSEDRIALKLRFDDYVKAEKVVFSTFHQSMSYEDFVEGIKPHTKNENVTYSVEDGLFKKIVKSALIEYLEVPETSNSEESFDTIYNDFINSISPLAGKRESVFTTKTGVEMMLVEANESSIQVKYLWSSKKKDNEGQHTFSVTKEKLKKVLLEGIEPSKVKSLQAELFPLIGHIHCELFAVYKSFYDFVIANNGEIETIQFNYKDQTFEEIKEQFDLLDNDVITNKTVKPYILIIDEINRGNVSQIFGELITLIEDSKRLGKEESLEVTLPYSKEKFGVPSNLYIIGTMNTADRSVESLDTALRRRFCFEEMLPDLEVLNGKEISGISLRELLETTNKRVEILLDRDHTIGHSYFINIKSEDDLKNIFKNNIIPLLQEYFYGDYEKIGMILGNGFFEDSEKYDKNLFANFATQNYPDAGNLIRLKTINESFDIIKALEILLKKEKITNE